MAPDDRKNLAHLGLTILVVGLVVAPMSHLLVDHAGAHLEGAEAWLTHGATQGHSHSHSHPHSDTHERSAHHHTHPPESTQHLTALFAPASLPAPAMELVAVAQVVVRVPPSPRSPPAWAHPAMPQGP